MIAMETSFEIIKISLAIGAALFTYYKFFSEDPHKQRIEFEIDCVDLGIKGSDRIIEIVVITENKGNVEHRFEDIRLHMRGIDAGSKLVEIEGHEPRLAFPIDLGKTSLVPEKLGYVFVRPNIKQRFTLARRVPASWTHIQARATFKYKRTDEFHTAERAFALGNAPA
jgi:hypothetical protein